MGRAELLELNELKTLLEEHQPILEDREKGLKNEVNEQLPALEHSIIGCIYTYNNSEKSAVDVIRKFGLRIVQRSIPVLTVGVKISEDGLNLVQEAPDYSITMTDVEVDKMISEFRELLAQIVHIAEHQYLMRELVDELNEVRRKNNAIKHALIPDIENQIKVIENKMEQEEIDTLIQLKFMEFA